MKMYTIPQTKLGSAHRKRNIFQECKTEKLSSCSVIVDLITHQCNR